jgi:hypothetical protein
LAELGKCEARVDKKKMGGWSEHHQKKERKEKGRLRKGVCLRCALVVVGMSLAAKAADSKMQSVSN